jgi:hypothetical protein
VTRRSGLVALALLPVALAAARGDAGAQAASVAATAEVSIPMVVEGLAPLAFGQLLPGVARTVAFDAATSGRMRIIAKDGATVRLTFTFPATLASGAATMPVGSWDVRVNNNGNTAGATPITVTSGTPFNRVLPASGRLFFFLGARVAPAATQPAGSYAGTIVLDAVYTGT